MSKVTLQDIGPGYNLQTVVNNNNDFIEEAFENTLSRDGTDPNGMEAPLDMNGFRVINVGAPEQLDDAVRLRDLTEGVVIANGAPAGGTVGQVLTKDSGADYDYSWQDIPEQEDEVGIVSIVAGTNISVDDTDPANPIISATGGGGGDYTGPPKVACCSVNAGGSLIGYRTGIQSVGHSVTGQYEITYTAGYFTGATPACTLTFEYPFEASLALQGMVTSRTNSGCLVIITDRNNSFAGYDCPFSLMVMGEAS